MLTSSNSQNPRVLVLEDEALILMAIESTLSDAGYQVETASTGAAALAMLDAHSFDVALLDIQLKSGNSLAVADALLKRAIPFAFSSGTDDPLPVEFSATPLIGKPFTDADLVSLVGSMLRPR